MRLTHIYGLVLFLGGAIGYAKAGSLPSLLAGVFGALFFFFCKSQKLLTAGLAVFTLFFLWRWTLTGSFMPAGLMSFLSLALVAWRSSQPRRQ